MAETQKFTRDAVLAIIRKDHPELQRYDDDVVLQQVLEQQPGLRRRVFNPDGTLTYRAGGSAPVANKVEAPTPPAAQAPTVTAMQKTETPKSGGVPPLPPGFVIDAETAPTTSRTTAPSKPDDRTPGQVAAGGVKQVGKGVSNFIGQFSPVRFREGWTQPTLEVPEAVQGVGQMGWHVLTGDVQGAMRDVQAPLAPVGPIAAGIAAGVAPESFQAPTQQEWDQSTQQATQTALSMAAPYAVSKVPAAVRGVQGAATRSGLAQNMAGMQGSGQPIYKSPSVVTDTVAPYARAIGRKLYDVTQDPKAQLPYVGQYIPPPGSTPPVDPGYIDAETVRPPSPPAVAPKQLNAAKPQLQIEAKTSYQPGLPESPVMMMPPGERYPLPPSPYLPEAYNRVPVYAPPAEPGVMLRGPQMLGEEGGIPPRGEQTITGVKPKPVREGGRFRKGTEEDLAADKGNFGRTTRKPVTAKKPPVKSPEKPKAPPKKK